MAPTLQVVPLGGLGEFGMNSMAVSTDQATLVIDAGVMFAGPELPGVDLLIPDLTYLQQCQPRPSALLLTHGHEDHIGGVPYVWPLIEGNVYGTPLTLALLRPKLEEHGIDPGDRLVAVQPRQRVRIGDCEVEFLRVTHSMPDCVALAVHTPAGTIVHTGDFKIDQTPIDGQHFDVHRFAELGSAGVLALFCDSTNIDRRGFTGSELEVKDAFEEVFTTATGKLVVTAFASSVYRMQILVDLADQFQRKVAFVGRGMLQTSDAAQRLGYLKLPAGRMIRDTEVESLPPSHVLCIATGSQGEPFAAMSRIAIDDHRYVKVGHNDTVVFSARAIPGNEKAIGHVMNHLARRGADVIYEGIKHVHVSGHGSEEELKLVLSLVRPRHFVPIHGEYRQLSQHARVAERVTAGLDPEGEGDADRERRHPALRRERRRGCGKGADRPRADRRLRLGRSDRRGPARSPAPRRGRRRGACRRDQQPDRRRRRRSGRRQPGAGAGRGQRRIAARSGEARRRRHSGSEY